MSTQFTNRQWRLPNNENKDKQSNYSMDFDSASSDYINVGNPTELQITGALTISAWVKINLTSPTQVCIVSKDDVTNRSYDLWGRIAADGFPRFVIYNSNTGYSVSGTTDLKDNQWHHIVAVFTPNTSLKIYIDNVLEATNTTSIPSSIDNDPANFEIGRFGFGTYPMDGQIDGVAIFNYALSSSQVTTLYGSSSTGIGNPMSLSPKPVAYYPLGDQDAFNGADYLVPNIAAQEDDGDIATSYSPYALDFDGVNDSIDCGDSDDFSFGDSSTDSPFSISSWVNMDDATKFRITNKYNVNNPKEWLFAVGGDDTLRLNLYDNSNQNYIGRKSTSALTSYQGQWIHVACTYDGSSSVNGIKLYLNGLRLSETDNTSGGYVAMENTTQPVLIAHQGSEYANGKISNISIWNAALTSTQVTEIYSEGIPQNLNNHSAYSNLVSWWQLGSNSSFNTNWTVLDEKGSNNGTSVNMTEVDIVDGVGSYANGLSSGMGGDEVIGSAPFSDANSLSVNMDVLDRVEDTPS